MRIFVEGVGLIGPGLNGWHASRALLAGSAPYVHAPAVIKMSDLLPPAERRRTGMPVKLALAAGSEAFANAGRDPATTATVFTSSSGDGENTHQICETLASPQREVSPTRFHNSVHNAAAGYWSIATRSHEASTSLCCYDASFAAGLLEVAAQIVIDGKPVALIAYDQPYPEPLNSVRPITAAVGVALVLTPEQSSKTAMLLDVNFVPAAAEATTMLDPGFEAVRSQVPAARSLPLLAALARNSAATVILRYARASHLNIAVAPCP
jgi:Beta-ketoacyl synthase, N-terminal domain